MTQSKMIRAAIELQAVGEPFPANQFWHLASPGNVRLVLKRMVESGELQRVARGVYVRPGESSIYGEYVPLGSDVVRAISEKTGETLAPHCAVAANLMQLSTQEPLIEIFYTSGASRTLKVKGQRVKLVHRNPKYLVKAKYEVSLAFIALTFLGKNHIEFKQLDIVHRILTKEDFLKLLKLVHKMPAWLAEKFNHYKRDRCILT